MDADSATDGRATGRHGRRAPEGSAPRGRDWAVRGRPRRGRPADQPQPPPTGATESREERAGREAPLPPHRSGEPGPRRAEAGGERTRCHGGYRRGRRERGGGAAAARPWLRLLRGPLGPQRRQMSTTPRGRRSCSSAPPAPSPAAAHRQAPTPQRLCRCAGLAGKCSAKLSACCRYLPYKELQLPGLNTAQGFASLSFSRPLCLWYSGATTSEDCWLMFSKSLCCAMGCLPY